MTTPNPMLTPVSGASDLESDDTHSDSVLSDWSPADAAARVTTLGDTLRPQGTISTTTTTTAAASRSGTPPHPLTREEFLSHDHIFLNDGSADYDDYDDCDAEGSSRSSRGDATTRTAAQSDSGQAIITTSSQDCNDNNNHNNNNDDEDKLLASVLTQMPQPRRHGVSFGETIINRMFGAQGPSQRDKQLLQHVSRRRSGGGGGAHIQRRHADKVHIYSTPKYSYYAKVIQSDDDYEGYDEEEEIDEDIEKEQQHQHQHQQQRSEKAGAELPTVNPRRAYRSACVGQVDEAEDSLYSGEEDHDEDEYDEDDDVYHPMDALSSQLPHVSVARLLEQERFALRSCPPYRIPLYDQACLKFIFPNIFHCQFGVLDVLNLFVWLIFAHVNLFLTVVNVIQVHSDNDDDGGRPFMPWVAKVRYFVFYSEFAVVMGLYLMAWITFADAFLRSNLGSRLAHDIATIVTHMSTFSVLRLVGFASPAFALRRIAPVFINAVVIRDYLKGALFVVIWLGVCVVAVLSVIAKVTQIENAFVYSISDWNVIDFFQVFGLVSNLARVDDSYYKEMSVLLDAVHKHFIAPGVVREAIVHDKDCLFTRLLKTLHIQQYMYYKYLEVIFNYHVNWQWGTCVEDAAAHRGVALRNSPVPPLTPTSALSGTSISHDNKKKKKKRRSECVHVSSSTNPTPVSLSLYLRRFFLYLSFAFSMDNVDLRRYLQMTQSPLPYYRIGRESFTTAFLEKDCVVMDMALWRNDPLSADTRHYSEKCPDQFNIRYVCDDRRDIWDPKYKCVDDVGVDTATRLAYQLSGGH